MPRFLSRGRLSEIRLLARVRGTGRGGTVLFAGTVRGTEKGRWIKSLQYDVYPRMAEREMGKIVSTARKRWHVAVALQHRFGRVPAGEAAVIVACAGKHRAQAFAACRFIIDAVKRKVPIWKRTR